MSNDITLIIKTLSFGCQPIELPISSDITCIELQQRVAISLNYPIDMILLLKKNKKLLTLQNMYSHLTEIGLINGDIIHVPLRMGNSSKEEDELVRRIREL